MKAKVLLKNIKVNDVFHFSPNDWSTTSNWCRENIFVAMKDSDGKMWLVDTYWGIGRWDNKKYSFSEANKLGTLKYYCNLDEIEEVGEGKSQYYEGEDRFVLSNQHACVPSCRFYYIKKGAQKSQKVMRELLDEAINKAKREIEYRVSEVERLVEKRVEVDKGNLEVYI